MAVGLVGIVALGVVPHRRIAVETVHRPGIDLERDGRAGELRRFGQALAIGSRRPIVLLADQDEERGRWLVAAGRAKTRTAPPCAASGVPRAVIGAAAGVERDRGGEAG